MEPDEIKYSIANLPKRPKFNQDIAQKLETQVTNVITNYYKLQFKQTNQKFYQYEVYFDPQVPANSRWVIRTAVEKIEKQLTSKIGYYIHRGNIIWGFKTTNQILSFNTKFQDKKTKTLFAYKINLKKTKQFRLSSLEEGFTDSQKVIQVLNSQLKKKLLKLGMVELGKSCKFYQKNTINKNLIENSDLKVWRGFKTSIHMLNSKAYLLVDFSSRILRKKNLKQIMKNTQADELDDLIGKTVICNYGNYRTYKIQGIQKKKTPMSTFKKSGIQITFKEYFKIAYNQDIKDTQQPLIKTFHKKKEMGQNGQLKQIITEVLLVPELLLLTGMTDDEIKDRGLMKDVAKFTKLDPNQRIDQNYRIIDTIFPDIQDSKSKKTKQIIDNEIFTIDKTSNMKGYLLKQPKIKLDNQIDTKNGQITVKTRLFDPINLQNFLVVVTLKNSNDNDDINDFINILKKSAPVYGIKIGKFTILSPKDSTYECFQEAIKNDQTKYGGKRSMIITFLTNFEAKFYSKLKKLLYVDIGVTHQNILRKNFFGKNCMSIASKILLQINAKLGKALWKVVRKHPDLQKKKILIGGMAIYHKLINKNKSCEAFVGTTNEDLTKFYSSARLIPTNQQRLANIEPMIKQWFRQSCYINKCIPDYIFFYRDGVGEGQITSILNIQLQAIKRGIKKVQEKLNITFKPGIAFILCNKKINQRIFKDDNFGEESKFRNIINPSSGTIMGSGISRYGFDFHLAAQQVKSGTCTPTQYNVIYNTTNLTEEAFWNITFQQCFNYYNWQGAVRVPASLMYANKLATLVGQHIKTQPNDKQLSEKLYCL